MPRLEFEYNPNFSNRVDADNTDEAVDTAREREKMPGKMSGRKFVPIEDVPDTAPSVEDQAIERLERGRKEEVSLEVEDGLDEDEEETGRETEEEDDLGEGPLEEDRISDQEIDEAERQGTLTPGQRMDGQIRRGKHDKPTSSWREEFKAWFMGNRRKSKQMSPKNENEQL